MSIRLIETPHKVGGTEENPKLKFDGFANEAMGGIDLDNDSTKGNEFDFDISFRFFSAADLGRAESNVEALIDHVRSNASTLHADGDRIFLWAFSGGGPFLSAAFDPTRRYIRGVISYYAALDVATPELRARFSPLERLKATGSSPPMFIGRAGKDFKPINAALKKFIDAALAHNVEIELMNHPSGEHGFDILNDDERSRAIIRRTIDFIREHSR